MKKQEQEFINISWRLLEAKVRYYIFPELQNISDADYDSLEKSYLLLCKKLSKNDSIQSMVGVDQSRPSVQKVIDKISRDELSKQLNRKIY